LLSVPFSFSLLFFSNKEVWQESGFPGGKANLVTLLRLILCLVLLISSSWQLPYVWFGLGIMIAALDGIDGYLARKEKKSGLFGSYFDMETDAIFVMTLSIVLMRAGIVSPWILLAGAWRYIFAISLIWLNQKMKQEGRMLFARIVAVLTMLGLSAAFILPQPWAMYLCLTILILLTISFGSSYRHMLKANNLGLKLKKGSKAIPWVFWTGLFAFQFALFAISYIGNIEDVSLIPSWQEADPKGLLALFYRINLDPFRLAFDVFLITLLSIGLFRLTKKIWPSTLLFFSFYTILFLYTGYEALIFRLFRSSPNFLSDVYIGFDVLPVFATQFQFSSSLMVLGIVAAILFLIAMKLIFIRLFITSSVLLKWTKWEKIIFASLMIWTLCGWAYVQLNRSEIGYFREDQLSSRFVSFDISKNTIRSLELLNRVRELDKTDWSAYAYPQKEMTVKPDIYLIFLESYGTVLLEDEELNFKFTSLLEEESVKLNPDWHVVSTWSEAPIKGGRSWLSFTSVLTGLDIDDHFIYSHLLKSGYPIPMMAKFFNQQGYVSYRLTSLGSNDDRIKIPYEQLSEFYGFTYWLLAEDLNYEGDFYGNVKAVPDQFAINLLHENYLFKESRPTFTFFITTASHWPWSAEQPPLLEDWYDLNETKRTSQSESLPNMGQSKENYWFAMEYQIKMMFDFLNRYEHENAVLIFLGDHQPPYLADDRTPGTTMVHAFSKDPDLLKPALEDGFESGYGLEEPKVIREHRDLFGIIKWYLE
jgi:phosphatidylglycerophosphate synthase